MPIPWAQEAWSRQPYLGLIDHHFKIKVPLFCCTIDNILLYLHVCVQSKHIHLLLMAISLFFSHTCTYPGISLCVEYMPGNGTHEMLSLTDFTACIDIGVNLLFHFCPIVCI